jgi:hypothetical protein
MKQVSPAFYLPHADFFLGLFFDPVEGGSMFLLNASSLAVNYATLWLSRQSCSEPKLVA